MIAVVTHQRRQIESDGETCLALLEQIVKAAVGFLRSPKAAELPHGPDSLAIHCLVDAASEGVLAGIAKIALVVKFCEIGGSIEAFNGNSGGRGEDGLPFRRARKRRL